MIRIGDSAILKKIQMTPQARGAESRRYWDWPTEWLEIAEKCIKEKKFSITTVCLNYFEADKFIPTEIQWRTYIEGTVKVLLAKGANLYNSRLDIINEPTKHVRNSNNHPDVDKYIWLEHIAVDQVRGRLEIGFGCDELVYDGWQSNVVSRCKGNTYVIHIQASCDTKAKTTNFVNIAKNRAVTYKKILDCNEGNYKNVSQASGFDLMKFQMQEAERVGCANYYNVFNDLVRSAYKGDTSQWDFLAFKIDGNFRNDDAERHYNEWTGLMDSKAPVPNIIEVEEDMKLDDLYYQGRPEEKYVRDPDKRGVKFFRACFGLSDSNVFDNALDAKVREYQSINGMLVDGKVGPETFGGLILVADYQKYYNWIQHDWATYSK